MMMITKVNTIMEKLTFLAEEIFEDIPGDPDNVIMKIPPEILERNGWKEGDTLNIELQDGAIVISKV
jgi:formylmethanofuran dehydrogenase subunit D